MIRGTHPTGLGSHGKYTCECWTYFLAMFVPCVSICLLLVHSFVDVFDAKTQFTADKHTRSFSWQCYLPNHLGFFGGDGHQLGAGNVRFLGVWKAVLWKPVLFAHFYTFLVFFFRHSRWLELGLGIWGEICCTLWLPPFAGFPDVYSDLKGHRYRGFDGFFQMPPWVASTSSNYCRFYLVKGALLKEWLDHFTLTPVIISYEHLRSGLSPKPVPEIIADWEMCRTLGFLLRPNGAFHHSGLSNDSIGQTVQMSIYHSW